MSTQYIFGWNWLPWLLMLVTSCAGVGIYEGYHVILVEPASTVEEVICLHGIQQGTARQVIFHNEPSLSGAHLTIILSPDWLTEVGQKLDDCSKEWTIVDTNFQRSIDKSNEANEEARRRYFEKKGDKVRDPPTAYLTQDEIDAWLQAEAAASPIAERFLMGQSYEGRDMYAIKINDGDSALPALWLDGGIHAREWIAHHTAMYIIDEILFGESEDAVYARDNFRWYIAPSINPDGYNYTFTTDRMWRKNRQPYGACFGADLNRNWDANFGSNGSSFDPCEDTHSGPTAFSEPESQVVRDTILANRQGMEAYVSLHAYGQMWLTPYGAFEEYAEDYEELNITAYNAINAIETVNGSIFYVGTPWELLYLAAGGSFDWAKLPDKANITYSYSLELRPRSTPEGGFLIGPENIEPSGLEIFAGLLEIGKRILLRREGGSS